MGLKLGEKKALSLVLLNYIFDELVIKRPRMHNIPNIGKISI